MSRGALSLIITADTPLNLIIKETELKQKFNFVDYYANESDSIHQEIKLKKLDKFDETPITALKELIDLFRSFSEVSRVLVNYGKI